MLKEKINAFLDEAKSINWFERCGKKKKKYHMVFSLYDANDGLWGMKANEVWEANICPLEDIAVEKIGDDEVDEIFETVCDAIGDVVWNKFGEFVARRHLDDQLAVFDELFNSARRDMAWACVEYILDMPGFFTMLKDIFKEGYFPCSWDGEYPAGRAVVL